MGAEEYFCTQIIPNSVEVLLFHQCLANRRRIKTSKRGGVVETVLDEIAERLKLIHNIRGSIVAPCALMPFSESARVNKSVPQN